MTPYKTRTVSAASYILPSGLRMAIVFDRVRYMYLCNQLNIQVIVSKSQGLRVLCSIISLFDFDVIVQRKRLRERVDHEGRTP